MHEAGELTGGDDMYNNDQQENNMRGETGVVEMRSSCSYYHSYMVLGRHIGKLRG